MTRVAERNDLRRSCRERISQRCQKIGERA
jgi:hypothetical protein